MKRGYLQITKLLLRAGERRHPHEPAQRSTVELGHTSLGSVARASVEGDSPADRRVGRSRTGNTAGASPPRAGRGQPLATLGLSGSQGPAHPLGSDSRVAPAPYSGCGEETGSGVSELRPEPGPAGRDVVGFHARGVVVSQGGELGAASPGVGDLHRLGGAGGGSGGGTLGRSASAALLRPAV